MKKKMKKLLFSISLSMFSLFSFSQVGFTSFDIPNSDNLIGSGMSSAAITSDCQSCDAALDPNLRSKIIYYKQSNLRDWLNKYFLSTEQQRRVMKNDASSNVDLNAVVNSIPIKFGYNSNNSKQYNYWSNKYIEWTNTRLISIDDIVYLFMADSRDQLEAWLECKKKTCGLTSANHTENEIFLDVEKIRDGRYNISITNLSKAKIKITEIQVDDVLEKISGKKFREKRKINNKGGKALAIYASKSTMDVNFSITVAYDVVGENDNETIEVTYRVKPELPDAPIGAIISTTLTYEQFLKVNQIENLSSSEQIWLPCDGRPVSNGNYITQTPDLRGVFIRGANIMDVNENNHTDPVDNTRKNPDNTIVGDYQDDAFESHRHSSDYPHNDGSWGAISGPGNQSGRTGRNTTSVGSNETRPKNITVLYLIRVR